MLTEQDKRFQAYLESQIADKGTELNQLKGEIDALQSALSAFKQIVVNDSFGLDKKTSAN